MVVLFTNSSKSSLARFTGEEDGGGLVPMVTLKSEQDGGPQKNSTLRVSSKRITFDERGNEIPATALIVRSRPLLNQSVGRAS